MCILFSLAIVFSLTTDVGQQAKHMKVLTGKGRRACQVLGAARQHLKELVQQVTKYSFVSCRFDGF